MGEPRLLLRDVFVGFLKCTTDQECNDHLYCNGVERCLSGLCYAQDNFTILELCGTENAFCCEDQKRCLPTNQAISPKFIVGAMAAAVFVAFIILLLMRRYFAFFKSDRKKNK